MPRRSHVKVGPGEGKECIHPYEIALTLPVALHQSLMLEVALINEGSKAKRKYTLQDLIRAILAAHQEHRVLLGTLVDQEDQ